MESYDIPELSQMLSNLSLDEQHATAVSPRIAVLSSPELLSLIFSFLRPTNLLSSVQQVCRLWHSAILSPHTQSSLFLHPRPASASASTHPVFPELLASSFPLWFKDLCSLGGNHHWPSCRSFHYLYWKQNPQIWSIANASWRNMLVVQPTCTELRLVKRVHAMMGDSESTCVISCPGGVRMGLLYDVVEEWCAESAGYTFAVRWDMLSDEDVPKAPLVPPSELVGLSETQKREKERAAEELRQNLSRWHTRQPHQVGNCITVMMQMTLSCCPSEEPYKRSLGLEWRSKSWEEKELVFGEYVNVDRGLYLF